MPFIWSGRALFECTYHYLWGMCGWWISTPLKCVGLAFALATAQKPRACKEDLKFLRGQYCCLWCRWPVISALAIGPPCCFQNKENSRTPWLSTKSNAWQKNVHEMWKLPAGVYPKHLFPRLQFAHLTSANISGLWYLQCIRTSFNTKQECLIYSVLLWIRLPTKKQICGVFSPLLHR